MSRSRHHDHRRDKSRDAFTAIPEDDEFRRRQKALERSLSEAKRKTVAPAPVAEQPKAAPETPRHEQPQEWDRRQPMEEFAEKLKTAGIEAQLNFDYQYKFRGVAAILTFPDRDIHTRYVKSEFFREGLAAAKRGQMTLIAAIAGAPVPK